MNKTITMLLVAAFTSCATAGDKKAKQPPQPKHISEGLYDMTERWQVMFGLDGRLKVSSGRRDGRAAPANGHERSSFVAKPKVAGWYAFTFIGVDQLECTLQVHTVRLHVFEGAKNSKPPVIRPERKMWFQAVSVAPGAEVHVKWSYYPGGEGVAGGWKLVSTSYSDGKLPPSVPGYEKASGE